jgi:pimeloyl-ACP methyl ester carboxylesterase
MKIPSNLGYEHHRITVDDGAELSVQTIGQGLPLVLANGIGVSYLGMTRIVQRLRDRYRLILWDYRGFGGSLVSHMRHQDFSVRRHAKDVFGILDGLGIDKAALLGWSMGCPVSLEAIRQAPERVTAFVSLFGAVGNPFNTERLGGLRKPLEAGVAYLSKKPKILQAALDLVVAAPNASFNLLTGLKLVGKNADKVIFFANIRAERDTDKRFLGQTIVELLKYDASDMLHLITCPTLIISGGRDRLTPRFHSEQLAAGIPGAQLCVIEEMTHFGLIENSDELMGPLEDFLASSCAQTARR